MFFYFSTGDFPRFPGLGVSFLRCNRVRYDDAGRTHMTILRHICGSKNTSGSLTFVESPCGSLGRFKKDYFHCPGGGETICMA